MKLLKTKTGELTRTVTGGEMLVANLNYSVEKAWGDLTYKGPKLPRDLWYQITSFLKWANDTAHSEAQVRLFVSLKHNTWSAWAFPQEGYAGLASKEIQDDEFKRQRAALFDKDDDWCAWGTVHSHAAVSAFQSSTDEADEEGQGGLHITVGNMSDKQYSFHARIYHKNDMFEPDMSIFWDVGDPFKELAPEIRALLPETPLDKLARIQMCVPVTVEFPNQWKNNYRKPEPVSEIKKLPPGLVSHAGFEQWAIVGPNDMWHLRIKQAMGEVMEQAEIYQMRDGELMEVLEALSEDSVGDIMRICERLKVSPEDIQEALARIELQQELQTGID